MPDTRHDADMSQLLFTSARTYNGWQDRKVPEEVLTQLYELVKMAPTSANCSPARFVFITSDDAKAKLSDAVSSGNREKTMTAPVNVIVAQDDKFYDKLPQLFPHTDARSWFTSSEAVAQETAFRNSTLQGAYLIMAARMLGLDCGPMSGFDKKKVNALFLEDKGWSVNFMINLGYGDPASLMDRLPRLDFDEACETL